VLASQWRWQHHPSCYTHPVCNRQLDIVLFWCWFLIDQDACSFYSCVCHSEDEWARQCLWTRYDSRWQVHQFECVKNCNAAGFFTLNHFPFPRMVLHPKDIKPTWQLWEALKSTWGSIPVERFRHLVESMPQQIEDVLRATQYSEGVPNVIFVTWTYTEAQLMSSITSIL
jgi:hypothetical protein